MHSASVATPTTSTEEYVVPVATIELFEPKGFSVSVPDSPGVSLFAFHGNINTPLANLEGGRFSQDIIRAKNGQWTFSSKSVELKPGDVINYWTYVIKNGLGYRRDAQQYTVSGKDAQPYTVPKATVELHQPKGFSVSIPHTKGITLFAFHGSVNEPLDDLAAGQFSKDINNVTNDRWTFVDATTAIKSGDIINYWTYVIKDGIGYRRDAQHYFVSGMRKEFESNRLGLLAI